MRVITENQILYYNTEGGSKVGNALKGIFKKKEGGTTAGNLLRSVTKGKGASTSNDTTPQPIQESISDEPTKKGISTGAWIGIGAGALFVVGIGVYLAVKK